MKQLFVVLGIALAAAAVWAGVRDAGQDQDQDQDQKVEPRAEPTPPCEECVRLQGELDRLGSERDALRTELADAQAQRVAREQEWLEYTRVLSSLEVPRELELPSQPSFLPAAEEAAPVEPLDPALAAAIERAEDARIDLNALLLAEHVFALDFLELGVMNEGWTGPVVARQLDDRGHLIGTLAADRLRLEVSRSGHSVTLVLEVGWESHGGVHVPFGTPEQEGGDRGGIRRVALPGIDPAPWVRSLPEIVRPEDLAGPPDDGRWNLIELRLVLGERIRLDSPGGRWRLVGIGGVMGGDIMDVHLAELTAGGRVMRRLFADSMRVRSRGDGLELVLTDGVFERDGEKAPFLDGSYRLFFPAAKPAVWKAAGVPGLSQASR